MSSLFKPFKLKDASLRNRIAVPPMCQYMAVDGLINDWHRAHLANPHWPYFAARRLGIERPSWVLPAPYAHWLERYSVD